MTTTQPTVRLALRLPWPWIVVDPDKLALDPPAGGTSLGGLEADLARSRPCMLASLIVPIVDEAGERQEILMASMAAYLASGADIAVPEQDSSLHVVRAPLAADVSIDFASLTIPVVSAEHDVTALLCFSSPNLPHAAELEAGFRAIAATARLVEPPADGA